MRHLIFAFLINERLLLRTKKNLTHFIKIYYQS